MERLFRLGLTPAARRVMLFARVERMAALVGTDMDHDSFYSLTLNKTMTELYILLTEVDG